MDFSNIQPPITFAVSTPVEHERAEDGSWVLWKANVKSARHRYLFNVFNDILFLEKEGVAMVYGIDCRDGLPVEAPNGIAENQNAFIHFIRDETARDSNIIGKFGKFFGASKYNAEATATSAYIVVRDVPLKLALSYIEADGQLKPMLIEDSLDDWLESVRSDLSFDEMTCPNAIKE